jgi:NAD(P)-dependent dehydrogenase (short-subunit alcohol dehydrogenase family)
MNGRFKGKVVVITGASAGIGAAAARQFAAEGAVVALAARSGAPLQALAAELERGGSRALAVPTDVGHPQAAARLLAHVAERFGGIDVLVNNAGANKRGPIERYTPEELATVVQVNLTAPIMLTRLVLPYLRTRGRGGDRERRVDRRPHPGPPRGRLLRHQVRTPRVHVRDAG